VKQLTRAPATDERFGRRIVAWQRRHGRHDLPWQRHKDPYAIWVSEIMLQQTQVATVMPYFERFITSFPDVGSLARASADDVMRLWSGLGYYSRARNLHRAASMIIEQLDGKFPQDALALEALPGVGRSTAAAIASAAFGERRAILDGNVKRVLCRYFGIDGDAARSNVERRLWAIAESLVPRRDPGTYNQGVMDLGATICVRRAPVCTRCPIANDCVAYRQGRVHELPAARVRKPLPERSTTMLALLHRGEILLVKRPPVGIWGGLWSLPEVHDDEVLEPLCKRRFGVKRMSVRALPQLAHGFTHFKLLIKPMQVDVLARTVNAAEPGHVWLPVDDARGAAIPVPVRRILEAL
jgi:A/G-specific adenine glycosylase